MPYCQNIIPTFYAGNVIIDPFPFSRYINYFQFGIISSQAITDSHWEVDVREPTLLRKTGWIPVNEAWSLEGDHAYLDHDLMWGGTAYKGVDIQYYQHPLQSPYELVFSYSGTALTTGRVLWNVSSTSNNATVPFGFQSQALTELSRRLLPVILTALGAALLLPLLLARRKRKLMITIR
jgi:hypothetical protein